jgi:hypothetical protein
VIFDKEDNVVVKTYAYTTELYDLKDAESLIVDSYDIFESFEGTLIRVFYYKKWYISTYKRLDAYHSYWNNDQSFGEIFEERVGKYYSNLTELLDSLDRECVYMFLIKPTKHSRLVSDASDDIHHVDTFKLYTGDRVTTELKIPPPKKLQFDNPTTMVEYIKTTDYKQQQGVVLRGSNTLIKVYGEDYARFLKIRNPAILDVGIAHLYLNEQDRSTLQELYPDVDFAPYVEALTKATTHLYNCLLLRKTRYVYVDHVENTVLKYYTEGDISLENMEKAILKQTPTRLSKIIELHKQPQESTTIITSASAA